jgi:hypothetical protein
MNKIPVFRTIGRAYGFAFGNLATIVGLIWLPMLVLVAMQYYVTVHYLNGYLSAFAEGNLYELNSATGLRYLSVAVALLLQAILVTPVMRRALGLRSGGAFVNFAIGPTALRVFGAMAALSLILIAIEYIAIIGLVIAFAAIAVIANALGDLHGIRSGMIAGLTIVGLLSIFLGAMIYIWLRLSLLVVAIAVAEKKIDLIRAWRLTGWNFWRIFFITIATALPLALVYIVLIWGAWGFAIPHLPTPATMTGWKGAPSRVLIWFVQGIEGRMPYLFGVTLLLAPFSIGLSTGAAAAAYRAVVPTLENNGPDNTLVPEPTAA